MMKLYRVHLYAERGRETEVRTVVASTEGIAASLARTEFDARPIMHVFHTSSSAGMFTR